jgi:hypothetical protein
MNLGNLFQTVGIIIIIAGLFFSILFYVYFALVWQTIARKLGYKKDWLAWIPIINIFLFPILADKKWYKGFYILVPVILYFVFNILVDKGVSFIKDNYFLTFIVVLILALIALINYISWTWIIFEKRKYPGSNSLIVILSAIPILGIFATLWYFVMLGIIAWIDK